METAARSLQLQLRPAEVKAPDDLDRVFTSMTGQVDAFVMGSTQMLFDERRRIVELAAKHRLPAMYGVRTHVEVGGLVSYGADEPKRSGVRWLTWPRSSTNFAERCSAADKTALQAGPFVLQCTRRLPLPHPSLRGIVSTRTSLIGRTVAASARYPWIVLLLIAGLTLAALVFTAKNFAMTADTAQLIRNGWTGGRERSPSICLSSADRPDHRCGRWRHSRTGG